MHRGSVSHGDMDGRPQGGLETRILISLSLIGAGIYLVADLVLHAYTASTVLLPICVTNALLRISGHRNDIDGGVALGYFAVFVSAICVGLVFGLLYFPIEHYFIRRRLPKRVLACRMIAAFLFFLLVWLAFPLKETL